MGWWWWVRFALSAAMVCYWVWRLARLGNRRFQEESHSTPYRTAAPELVVYTDHVKPLTVCPACAATVQITCDVCCMANTRGPFTEKQFHRRCGKYVAAAPGTPLHFEDHGRFCFRLDHVHQHCQRCGWRGVVRTR